MESKDYMNAEELLTENLHLHEQLHEAYETVHMKEEELADLKTMLEIAQNENLKVFRAYFEVSEKLRMYEYRDKEKVPFLKRFINDD